MATKVSRPAKNWTEAAAAVTMRIRPFVDGDYRASTSTEFHHNIKPASETVICEVAVGGSEDVDAAVQVARRRFDDGCWSGLPPVRRAEILLKLADLIVEHSTELAPLDSLEMGKPFSAALQDAESFAPAPVNTGTLMLNVMPRENKRRVGGSSCR